MSKHVTVPIPAVPGINLSFRPTTYFGPLPLETHLLSHVTGHERRELEFPGFGGQGKDSGFAGGPPPCQPR